MGGIRHLGLESENEEDKDPMPREWTPRKSPYLPRDHYYDPPKKQSFVFQNGEEVNLDDILDEDEFKPRKKEITEWKEKTELIICISPEELGPIGDPHGRLYDEQIALDYAIDVATEKLEKLIPKEILDQYWRKTIIEDDDYQETKVRFTLTKKQ